MIYPYKCDVCGYYDELYVPMREINNIPIHCDQPMRRVYASFGINMRIASRTPPGMVELGNEFDSIKSVRPEYHEPLSTREEREQVFAECPELGALPD